MAKIRFQAKKYLHRGDRRARPVRIQAEVGAATYGTRKKKRYFSACMWVGGAKSSYKVEQSAACGTARNPRLALAAAARTFASRLAGKGSRGIMKTGRRGVFAGFR